MCQSNEVWKHWEKYQELFVNEVQTKKKSQGITISSFPYFSSQFYKLYKSFLLLELSLIMKDL